MIFVVRFSFRFALCVCATLLSVSDSAFHVFMFSVNNCGTAPYVAHATSTGSTTFGSTVNYTCETGYSGGGSLTCPDSGTWPPTSFNCTGMSSLCRVVQPVLVFFSRFLFVLLLLLLLLLCVCVCCRLFRFVLCVGRFMFLARSLALCACLLFDLTPCVLCVCADFVCLRSPALFVLPCLALSALNCVSKEEATQ